MITVLIPAYNHEKYIGLAIDSVLNQSFQDWELVIIDDGSTDNTRCVCNSYSDKRIRYYYQDNADAYNAINAGISLAKGKYISILNSDDIYHADRLRVLSEKAEKDNLDCIFTNVVPIDKSGMSLEKTRHYWNVWHEQNRKFYFDNNKNLFHTFLHANIMVTTSNLFVRKSLFEKLGLFAPIRYLHDYDYMFRIIKTHPDTTHYMHDKELLYYRIHGKNTLYEDKLRALDQDFDLISKNIIDIAPPDTDTGKILKIGIERLTAIRDDMLRCNAKTVRQRPLQKFVGKFFNRILYKLSKKRQ